jgi:hypothetical protein
MPPQDDDGWTMTRTGYMGGGKRKQSQVLQPCRTSLAFDTTHVESPRRVGKVWSRSLSAVCRGSGAAEGRHSCISCFSLDASTPLCRRTDDNMTTHCRYSLIRFGNRLTSIGCSPGKIAIECGLGGGYAREAASHHQQTDRSLSESIFAFHGF